MDKYDNPLRKENVTLKVEISNIKAHHAVALIHFFKHMEYAGKIGTSRYYAFFADGDGDFHPRFNGESNIELPEIEYDIGKEIELYVHKISPYGDVWNKVYGDYQSSTPTARKQE